MPKAWHYSRPSGMRTTGCRFVSGRMNPSSSQPSGPSVLMSPCSTPSSTPLDPSCREHWPLCRASGGPAEGLRLVPRESGRSEQQSTTEHLPESTIEGGEAGPFLARCGAVLGTLLRMPQNWVSRRGLGRCLAVYVEWGVGLQPGPHSSRLYSWKSDLGILNLVFFFFKSVKWV